MKRITFAAIAALMLLPASAMARDSNHDKLPDGWERRHHLSLKKNQAKRDQDRDGVRNRAEFRHGLDPRDRDSDDDGTEDGSEAGKITGYDTATGKLTITLIDASVLTGIVNNSTEIECDASDDHVASSSSRGDDDEAGDDHGGRGDDDEADDDGNNHGRDDDDDDGDGDRRCSTSALTVGALVHEAELKVTAAGAVWREIELV